MLTGARAALAVLTRLNAGRLDTADFTRAPGWFALIGLALGLAQALALALAGALWGVWLGAIAALAVGLILTGALHEDGLADTADALGAPRPAERALEIMRDSRIGSYGALALVLVLGAQVAALAALGPAAPWALAMAAGLSRACAAEGLRRGPYLRATGAASGMTGRWGWGNWAAALTGAALSVAIGMAALGLAALAGAALGLLAAVIVFNWGRARLGGITGDILGAVQQAGFTGTLLGVLAWG